MGFHRFEDYETLHLNPLLSSTRGPVIEGELMYFRRVTKSAGTMSKPHYHANEFMAFMLGGRMHAVLGKRGRLVKPGTLVHIPSNARHSFKARDDIEYLYVKDRTSNLFGTAADAGAITEGLGNCYYPLADGGDTAQASAHTERWTEGVNLAFALVESPQGHAVEEKSAPHEIFGYVLSGELDAEVGGVRKLAAAGDVIHVPRGTAYAWTAGGTPARYALVRSTPRLENEIAKNGATDNWRG